MPKSKRSVFSGSWLERDFKKECSDRSKQIDSQDEYDWYSLTLGWAIGKGIKPGAAKRFAIHIRYNTGLG